MQHATAHSAEETSGVIKRSFHQAHVLVPCVLMESKEAGGWFDEQTSMTWVSCISSRTPLRQAVADTVEKGASLFSRLVGRDL